MRTSREAILVHQIGDTAMPSECLSIATSKRAKWKILVIAGSVRSRPRLGALVWPLRDADDIDAAVAGRELHQAEPVAAGLQPHRLGIDRHEIAIGGEIAEVAFMDADIAQESPPWSGFGVVIQQPFIRYI